MIWHLVLLLCGALQLNAGTIPASNPTSRLATPYELIRPKTYSRSRALQLNEAVINGNSTLAIDLLSQGAYARRRYENGQTPLHVAAGGNDTALIYALLQAKANPHALDAEGHAPINYASMNGNQDNFDALLSHMHYFPPLPDGSNALNIAAGFNASPTMINALLERGIAYERDSFGMTPLDRAVTAQNFEAINLLADRTPWPASIDSFTAYLALVIGANDRLFAVLFAHIPPEHLNATMNTIIYQDPEEEYLLHKTVIDGDIASVKLLIQAGAKPNCRNRMRRTPLITALLCNAPEEIIRYLWPLTDRTLHDTNGNDAITLIKTRQRTELYDLIETEPANSSPTATASSVIFVLGNLSQTIELADERNTESARRIQELLSPQSNLPRSSILDPFTSSE